MKFTGKLLFIISCFVLLGISHPAFARKHLYSHSHHPRHSTHQASHTTTSSATIYGTEQLVAELNRIIGNTNPNLNIGVQIKSMRVGDVLYNRNSSHFFVPASILKVCTAESALLYLGPEFKFATVFATDAKNINAGVLEGNLYLIHSGDPSLTYIDLYDLMAGLQARHITQVNGNVYIDTSAYDQEMYGPGWISNDTRFCYGAPISASIINHNCMLVKVSSQSSKKRKQVIPSRISSMVVTDIAHYNRSLMQNLFIRYGIRITGDILPGTASRELPIVVSHESKPLRDLISTMLKKSDNIIAGSLFKKMGEVYAGQPGSWGNGSAAVKTILKQKVGVDIWQMNVLDGSGLSRDNRISPSQMMQVLDFAYHHVQTSYDFINALPIAGVDGTLKHRLQNIKWKVRAKTGTMSGVVALAGYAISKTKEPIAFVIIINGQMGLGWKYKEVENKITTALTNYMRGGV